MAFNSDETLPIGKINEKILKLTVFNKRKIFNKEVLNLPNIGRDCAYLEIPNDIISITTDPITISDNVSDLAINVVVNDLAASFATPIAVLVTILLPVGTTIGEFVNLSKSLEEISNNLNINIIGGHTEVTDSVNKVVISTVGIGTISKNDFFINKEYIGADIVMTKTVGIEGTYILANKFKDRLIEYFNEDFVESMLKMKENISVLPESEIAKKHNPFLGHDITEGGIYGALWEISEVTRCGIEVDIDKILIAQETIEICEYFNINPYKLISSGSMLIVCKNGDELVSELELNNINASVIGKITDNKEKIIFKDGKKSFIYPQTKDEIYNVDM